MFTAYDAKMLKLVFSRMLKFTNNIVESWVYLIAGSFSRFFQLAWPPGKTLLTSSSDLLKKAPMTALPVPNRNKKAPFQFLLISHYLKKSHLSI